MPLGRRQSDRLTQCPLQQAAARGRAGSGRVPGIPGQHPGVPGQYPGLPGWDAAPARGEEGPWERRLQDGAGPAWGTGGAPLWGRAPGPATPGSSGQTLFEHRRRRDRFACACRRQMPGQCQKTRQPAFNQRGVRRVTSSGRGRGVLLVLFFFFRSAFAPFPRAPLPAPESLLCALRLPAQAPIHPRSPCSGAQHGPALPTAEGAPGAKQNTSGLADLLSLARERPAASIPSHPLL